jgi:hypothetical protein
MPMDLVGFKIMKIEDFSPKPKIVASQTIAVMMHNSTKRVS